MTISSSSNPANGTRSKPIGVMIVDDSAVIRGLITRILESEDDIEVVASVGDGLRAVKAAKSDDNIEVVILDIEMPVMDGLTALPELLKENSNLKVIMSSTLTLKNADVSLRALTMGAAAYIPKPTSMTGVSGSQEFRRELTQTVRALGGSERPIIEVPSVPVESVEAKSIVPKDRGATPEARPGLYRNKDIVLRNPGKLAPLAIAVGSSTGGPQALFELFEVLGESIRMPIFVTQHMPPKFTTILAERLSKVTGNRCAEGKDGEEVQEKRIYLAPGDFHMTVSSEKGLRTVHLNQNEPENFCRPAVDPMLRSLSDAYGGRILTVILTGMGADGYNGSTKVVADGGTIVAQDDETSVVWGMPGAVATGGLCTAVLPLKEIAATIKKLIAGEAS
jgi:two-component system chemotaxis response regulator CheB